MMMDIEWSAFSIEDRAEIFDYIELDSPWGAILVDERISEQVATLSRYPQLGKAGRVLNTRELVISDTAYIVVYRLLETSVLILRINHSATMWPEKF